MNIKEQIAERLQNYYDIDPEITETLFLIGVIDEGRAKDFLIQDDYDVRGKKYHFKKECREDLATIYCCSLSKVEKIIYQQI